MPHTVKINTEIIEIDSDFAELGDLDKLKIVESHCEVTPEYYQTFMQLSREYFWIDPNYTAIQEAMTKRIKYNKNFFKQGQTFSPIIPISMDNIKEIYSIHMFNLYKEVLKRTRLHYEDKEVSKQEYLDKDYFINDVSGWRGEDISNYLETIITEEEILSNALNQKIVVSFKDKKHTYNKGTKLTKLLSLIAEQYYNIMLKDKVVGNFLPQLDFGIKDLYLSLSPVSVIAASLFGESCTSNGGENQHSGFIAVGYPNYLVAHDSNYDFRAFVYVDHDAKKFYVAAGYPRESFKAQIALKQFFDGKGYTLAPKHYFNFPAYVGRDGLFEVDAETDEERKSSFHFNVEYSQSLFNHYPTAINKIVVPNYCEACDRYHFDDPNSYMCDRCIDERSQCDRCGGYEWNDNMTYNHNHHEYYCEDCAGEVEEEDKKDFEERNTLCDDCNEWIENSDIVIIDDYSICNYCASNRED
jgi:hypothetical protein